MVVGFGGFYIAHISHLSLYCTAVWLPWLLWLITKCFGEHRGGGTHSPWRCRCPTVLRWAMHRLHCCRRVCVRLGVLYCWARNGWKTGLRGVVGISLAVVGGTAVALPQLLPTLQLSQLSERAGGVSADFFHQLFIPPRHDSDIAPSLCLGQPLSYRFCRSHGLCRIVHSICCRQRPLLWTICQPLVLVGRGPGWSVSGIG